MHLTKTIPFHVFQEHCCERRFKYLQVPNYFLVACSLANADQCNPRICPVWNGLNSAAPLPQNHSKPLPAPQPVQEQKTQPSRPMRYPNPTYRPPLHASTPHGSAPHAPKDQDALPVKEAPAPSGATLRDINLSLKDKIKDAPPQRRPAVKRRPRNTRNS